jgi:hypothetical protein
VSAGGPATEWFTVAGRSVDSAFIINQARASLIDDSTSVQLQLLPDSVVHVSGKRGVYEGFIVRMLVSAPSPTIGGGGLVWVDGETGWASRALAQRRQPRPKPSRIRSLGTGSSA